MYRRFAVGAVLLAGTVGPATAFCRFNPFATPARASSMDAGATPKSLFDFTVNDAEGKPVSLKKFESKTAILVVNVASK
jgi:cytochrome oxidase Cu insertion factor (SCO1/SenC/PrrC family)